MTDLTPLTESEQDATDALIETVLHGTVGASESDDAPRLATLRVRLDPDNLPEEVAVLIAQYHDEGSEDEMGIFPLAILLTPEVFDGVVPPEGSRTVVADDLVEEDA